MRKSIVGLTAVLVVGLTSSAYGHPSENRADVAFHGGPHCHVNVNSDNFAFPVPHGAPRLGPGERVQRHYMP